MPDRAKYHAHAEEYRAYNRQRHAADPLKHNIDDRIWYAVNADELLDRRRAKYHSDPEYRRRILESNRRSKKRNHANSKED